MVPKRAGGEIASGFLFLYNFSRKEGATMDSYDNDGIMMMLDDDLFFLDQEDQSEAENVD